MSVTISLHSHLFFLKKPNQGEIDNHERKIPITTQTAVRHGDYSEYAVGLLGRRDKQETRPILSTVSQVQYAETTPMRQRIEIPTTK